MQFNKDPLLNVPRYVLSSVCLYSSSVSIKYFIIATLLTPLQNYLLSVQVTVIIFSTFTAETVTGSSIELNIDFFFFMFTAM